MTQLDLDLLASQRSIRSDAVPSASSRVVVLYEPGRSGSAALDLARRLVVADGSALTVVTVAPQDTRICCGAGSALDYNRAVCEAADAELRAACQLLGPVGNRAVFTLLVQDKDPPLADWIASGCFDIVLLPARRRPRRRTKHPAADQVRRSTRAEVRVVEAGSNFEGPGVETPRAVGDKLGAPIDGVHSTRRRAEDTLPAKASEAVSAGAGPVHGRGATSGASGDGRAVRATGLAALGA